MMQRHTLQDLLHRTMTGEETFYIASEFDPLVKLWTDQEAVIGALHIGLASRDERIAELEEALRSIKRTLIDVNRGIEMGAIDSELLATANVVLRETD